MNKLKIVLFLFLAVALTTPLYTQKTNIAILQFDAENITGSEARILSDRLRTELLKIGAFNVVDRSAMEEILQEQGFQQTGCVSDECIVEVGKLVGVELMVGGTIGKIGTIYTISARMIDVKTGKILSQQSLDCPCPIETILTESMAQVAAGLSGATVITTPTSPKPTYGSVRFTSILKKVKVFSHEEGEIVELLGETPLSISELYPGKHEYMAVMDGYRTQFGDYSIEAGRDSNVDIMLIQKSGSLSIRSMQKDVSLSIDGEDLGNTPYSIDNMPIGNYRLLAQSSGFRDLFVHIPIKDGETTYRSLNLKYKLGYLSVIPHRTEQKFDLFVREESFHGINRKTVTLREGEHDVKIKEFGYHDLEKTVLVKDDKTTNFIAENEPILVPVSLQLHPISSSVLIDGKLRGPPMLKDLTLPYGLHTFTANASKYKGKGLTFTVNKNKPVIIDLRLEPKSRKTAALLSTVIPGSGQIYSDNSEKGLIFMVASVGLAAVLNGANSKYQEEHSLMVDYQQDYQNATDPAYIAATWEIYQDQVNSVNDVQAQLVVYGVVLGATWIANTIDAWFFNGIPDE
jgi:TolB-like protein